MEKHNSFAISHMVSIALSIYYLEASLLQDFATKTRPETVFFTTEALLFEDQTLDV
jgi:hypothetical protein